MSRYWALIALFIFGGVAFGVLDPGEDKSSRSAGWAGGMWLKKQGIALDIDQPTEFRNVRSSLWENIPITCPPIQVDKFSPILRVDNILGSDGSLIYAGGKAPDDNIVRPDKAFLLGSGGVVECVADRERRVSYITNSLNPHLLCRSITAVFPSWLEPPCIMSAVVIDHKILVKSSWINEAGFISNQSFLSKLGLPVGHMGEDDRENCYDDGRDCTDNRVILIDEGSSAYERNRLALQERHADIGRTFYLLCGSLACFLIAYALFENR